MASSLMWLDHDAAAYERSATLLELLEKPDTRDELGFGRIRDALADQLFPGTSVIQKRLRYMLLLPRMYLDLENSRVAAKDFGTRARAEELKLNGRLNGEAGAFGRDSGSDLKRLASSVYWAGMRSWGILVREGSQQNYYSAIDQIRAERSQVNRYEDGLDHGDLRAPTWHPSIEKLVPSSALEEGSLALTRSEAEFIREQWKSLHASTLLVWLAQDESRLRDCAGAPFPWLHPQLLRAPRPLQNLVEHARRFSGLAHGALLVYNLGLAEASDNAARKSQYGSAFEAWIGEVPTLNLDSWDMQRFWEQVEQGGRPVHPLLRSFVEEWLGLVKSGKADGSRAREIVRRRERWLKGNLSRFNPENLPRWGGASGLGLLNYRWLITRHHLADLLQGLQAA